MTTQTTDKLVIFKTLKREQDHLRLQLKDAEAEKGKLETRITNLWNDINSKQKEMMELANGKN